NQITYTSKSQRGTIDLLLTFGSTQATANVSAGGVTQGQNAQPETVDPNGRFGFLGGTAGKWLGLLLGVVAAGLLAYGIVLIVVRERSTLESALQPYSGEGEAEDTGYIDESTHGAFADSAFFQRAVAATGKFADERGLLV